MDIFLLSILGFPGLNGVLTSRLNNQLVGRLHGAGEQSSQQSIEFINQADFFT